MLIFGSGVYVCMNTGIVIRVAFESPETSTCDPPGSPLPRFSDWAIHGFRRQACGVSHTGDQFIADVGEGMRRVEPE